MAKKKTREPRSLTAGSRIAIYPRDSGGPHSEKSVPDQRRELYSLAQERGWVIVREFVDVAKPAGSVDGRDAFLEMLDECKRNPEQFDGILVWDFSRFSRGEPFDTQIYKATIRRLGIEVVSATEAIPEGDFGPLVEFVIDLKNRLFLKDLSRNVKRGLRTNAQHGYAHGGRPPWGYQRQPEVIGTHRDGSPRIASKWMPAPVDGPRATQVFELFASGASFREIETATGVQRPDATWSAMLRSETYAGVLRCGAERYPGAIPALCSPETWIMVQKRLMSEHPSKPRVSDFLLSGMLRCGHCEGIMSGGTDHRNDRREGSHMHGRPWRHYRCNNKHCSHRDRVNAELLESRVLAVVRDQILTVANVRPLLDKIQASLAGSALDERIADLGQRIGQAQRAIGNLMDAIEQGGMDSALEQRYRQRQAELTGFVVEREELERQRTAVHRPVTDELLEETLSQYRTEIGGSDITKARSVLRAFVKVVVVQDGQFRVDYNPELLLLGTGVISVPPRGFVDTPCTWFPLSALADLQS